jgi:cytoskeletal protein CcmA (bactofilin family)
MDLTKSLQHMGKKKEVTLIAADAELSGDVSFSSQLIVNGVLKGTITAEEPGAGVTISPSGRVIGDIRAPMVLIHGRVDGNVHSLDALEVADGAIIHGDLHYRILKMHMGASVQGRLIHTVPDENPGENTEEPTPINNVAEEQVTRG